MRRKRTPMGEKRTHKMTICFNDWERDTIEQAIHVQGMKRGWHTSFASFVRGHAIAKAYAINLQWQKCPKAERIRIEQEFERDYGEMEDHQDIG